MTSFQERFARRENVASARHEYDDRVEFVADFGGAEASVDVVDGTVIVVVGTEQFEFEVPEGEVTTHVNNGVVTVEVRR